MNLREGNPEIVVDGDVFFDYCHFRYSPVVSPEGKWRSIALLENSFRAMNCGSKYRPLVDALRNALGTNSTVWGVKKIGGRFFWEFYFYNYGKEDRRVIPSTVLEVMSPYFRLGGAVNCDRFRYFMFSIDIVPESFESGELNGLHLYVHDGQERQTGLSYFCDGNTLRLENHYAFYTPAHEWRQLAVKVIDSVWLDPTEIPVDAVLLPELTDCHTICVANKQACDAVYFSRINYDQFLYFLRRFEYPEEVVLFVEENRQRLDQLLFDVGFDYCSVNGELTIQKSGYYGAF